MKTLTKKSRTRLDRTISKLVRMEVCEAPQTPIEFVNGFQEPEGQGEYGGHFTRGGDRIQHPSGYSKKGWSNMVYHCSTRKIIVGIGWVCEALADHYAEKEEAKQAAKARRKAERQAEKEAWKEIQTTKPMPTEVKFTAEGGFSAQPSSN